MSNTAINLGDGDVQAVDPDTLNLRQLRIELKRFGLSPSGSKADLIRRYKLATGVIDVHAEDASNKTTARVKSRKEGSRLSDVKSSKRKARPPSKLVMTTSSILDAENDDLSHSDEDYDGEEDDGWRTFMGFYNKRRALGLDDEEIEKRKKTRINLNEEEKWKNPTEYAPVYESDEDTQPKKSAPIVLSSPKNKRPSPSSSSSSVRASTAKESEGLDEHLLDMAQMRFFDHAALELERIKLQREYDGEISKLEGQVEGMKRQIMAKDKVIEALRTGLFSRGSNNNNVPVAAPVQEAVYNWMAIQRLIG